MTGFNFKTACTALLREFGAVDSGDWYDMQIETVAGALDLSVHETWLACRFVDVERAKALLGADWGGRLNPISGKWNFPAEKADPGCVVSIRAEIQRVLAKQQESSCQ